MFSLTSGTLHLSVIKALFDKVSDRLNNPFLRVGFCDKDGNLIEHFNTDYGEVHADIFQSDQIAITQANEAHFNWNKDIKVDVWVDSKLKIAVWDKSSSGPEILIGYSMVDPREVESSSEKTKDSITPRTLTLQNDKESIVGHLEITLFYNKDVKQISEPQGKLNYSLDQCKLKFDGVYEPVKPAKAVSLPYLRFYSEGYLLLLNSSGPTQQIARFLTKLHAASREEKYETKEENGQRLISWGDTKFQTKYSGRVTPVCIRVVKNSGVIDPIS